MARGKKGGTYEMVLEGRHVLGIFFAIVLFCALFFTLGYVLGRKQAGSEQAASPTTAKKKPAAAERPGPAADDLSFYDRVEGKQPPENLPAARPPARPERKPAAAKPVEPVSQPAPVYLQVAALTQEPDAKRLVRELRKLGFPCLIRPPRDDRFHRVLVGPFESDELATAAQDRLEAQGFRDIIRR